MFLTPKPLCTFFIFTQILLLLKCEQQHFYTLQLILNTFYIYKKKKIKIKTKFFDFLKCLVIINQSRVYKLVIFFEFTLFSLMFSSFLLTFFTFSFILSYFCFYLIIRLNYYGLFPCKSMLGTLKFQCYRVYFQPT